MVIRHLNRGSFAVQRRAVASETMVFAHVAVLLNAPLASSGFVQSAEMSIEIKLRVCIERATTTPCFAAVPNRAAFERLEGGVSFGDGASAF